MTALICYFISLRNVSFTPVNKNINVFSQSLGLVESQQAAVESLGPCPRQKQDNNDLKSLQPDMIPHSKIRKLCAHH